MSQVMEKVDHAALRTNQAMIIGLLLGAYVANALWLVALVAVVMTYGALRRQPGFKVIYTNLLRPRGWVRPEVINDNPEPHVFAQGLGAAVLWLGVLAFVLALGVLGWALAWVVIALAALNLFVGICVGCAVYYWLNRLHLPGFVKAPPPGTFPGMRPKTG